MKIKKPSQSQLKNLCKSTNFGLFVNNQADAFTKPLIEKMEENLLKTGPAARMWVSKEKECPFYDNFKIEIDKLVEKMDLIEKGKKNTLGREVTNNDIYE